MYGSTNMIEREEQIEFQINTEAMSRFGIFPSLLKVSYPTVADE